MKNKKSKKIILLFVLIVIVLLIMSGVLMMWHNRSSISEEKRLYEAFMNTELTDLNYVYTYFDYDGDGREELYLRQNDSDKTYGYIVRYEAGGLQFLYQREVPEEYCEELEWSETPKIQEETDGTIEMIHSGMYVYVSQNGYEEAKFWYLDEDSFLNSYGFAEVEPLYEYCDENGNAQIALYYDNQREIGCGIRYYARDSSTFEASEMYGFTFAGINEVKWEDIAIDYLKPESYDGETGEDFVSDYQENYEYDEEGRIIHYESTGVMEDAGEELERSDVLKMDYEYGENGCLKYRLYYHNPRIFGTWCTTWESYFDELGRVEYENCYITHGHMEYYYIYTDESEVPTYRLMLDCNMGDWIPDFSFVYHE